jgi:lipopolysaccharide transport protein LptA
VLRDEQVIDTDHAIGHLSAENDIVTGIDLRGNARVTGGPSIESMHARDITLDYTDDGTALEAAKLIGGATIAMKTMAGAPGRRIHGEVVDITLAPDNTLTSAVARENVRLDLPAAGDTPRRSILARTLDGAGQAGKGLTQALFTGGVTFTEESLRPKGVAADKPSGMRSARSQRLEASLADDTVTSATFTGEVSFEETGLKACAAKADYDPQKGTLALSGATASGPPMAAEEQVAIEGETINVGLDNRKMSARGGVRTFMHAPEGQRCKPSAQRDKSEQGASQMPRLLKADAPVRISAASLEYDGDKGYADYFGGRVRLDQESTQIGADRLVLDQTKGDLVATGNVVSSLPLDDKSNRGQADEMRYSDERRLLTYTSQANAPASIASLTSGPGSILRARTIVLTLAPKENTLQTMRAERNVFVTEGPQTVTGGTRLDYTAADELFVITGDGSKPVVAIKRDGGQCRETSGNDVRFQKGKDAVSVTGGKSGNANTRPAKDVACTTPPAR